jgi:hypothetical protein
LDGSQPPLLGFGGDSFIELFSAIGVGRETRGHSRWCSALCAGGVRGFGFRVYATGLERAKANEVGGCDFACGGSVLPWLAKRKRSLAAIIGSAALKNGCYRVCNVWLFLFNRLSGVASQFLLAHLMG